MRTRTASSIAILKPSNILLDDGGGVFITDFGIARILSEGSSNITTQGVVGTPSYMSPEQAQGESLDGRSDVYSLGVMLFELVTGRRPFESDTPYSIAVMHVTMPPPSPREFEPGISSEIEGVVLRALQKSPEDRYATASELAWALRRALRLPPVAGEGGGVHGRGPALAQKAASRTLAAPIESSAASGNTSRSAKLPPFTRRLMSEVPRRRMWLGVAAGGALGCVMLVVLLIMAVSLLGVFSSDNGSSVTATQNPGFGCRCDNHADHR